MVSQCETGISELDAHYFCENLTFGTLAFGPVADVATMVNSNKRQTASVHRLETAAIRPTLIKLPERDQRSVPLIGLRQQLQAHLGYRIPKARQDRAC